MGDLIFAEKLTLMKRELLVVLGASNVYHSLPWLLSRVAARGNCELFLACGPGRSYGAKAGNLLASYPGLGSIALFEHLESVAEGAELKVVVADVGNDLIYEQPPEKVALWVDQVFVRFLELGAEVSWVDLPYESLKLLPPSLFYFFRSLYYWNSRVDLPTMLDRVGALQQELQGICARRGMEVLPVSNEWFTVDRFHLRGRHFGTAWRQWLGGPEPERGPLYAGWTLEPSYYWLLGRERRRLPSHRLANGLLVHSY